jgi:hypothetical protein
MCNASNVGTLLAVAVVGSILAAGCATTVYQPAQLAPLRTGAPMPVFVDASKTSFSGSSFPSDKVELARSFYPSATVILLQQQFKEAGVPVAVVEAPTKPASGAYLLIAIEKADSSSNAGAIFAQSNIGILGFGKASAEITVSLFDAHGANVMTDKFSAEGQREFNPSDWVSKDTQSANLELLANPGGSCLYQSLGQFATKVK